MRAVVDTNQDERDPLHARRNKVMPMGSEASQHDDMPAEIDFRSGQRGLHHTPPDSRILMPVSIDRAVWEYFAAKAKQNGVEMSDLLTDLLKRDIEISEALK